MQSIVPRLALPVRSSLRTFTPRHAHRIGLRHASLYNTQVAGLTEEQNEFRLAVREFAQREIAPRAAEIDRSNEFPAARFPRVDCYCCS